MKKTFLILIPFVLAFVLPLKTLDTWMTPDVRLDTGDTPGAHFSNYPQIASSESNVYVVWEDNRNGIYDIYFNYSNDNGLTWQFSDIRLDTGDTAGANASYNPQIAFSGNSVYVVWLDYRNGSFSDIYFNYSSDNGMTWQPSDIRLDTGDSAGANHSEYPQIACSGSHVYAVWLDSRNGAIDVYFNYSGDNGSNWQSSDIRLDTGDTAGANDSFYPQIACSGNSVYAVWEDWRNGNYDIYFNYSIDNGHTWQPLPLRLDTGDTAGANESRRPQIACTGSHVYAVWFDKRNGRNDIYFNYSPDRGLHWQIPDYRLDTGDNDSYVPQIACTDGDVYVVWHDYRNGDSDIYFNHSADNGLTWQSSDIRLDTGDSAGTKASLFPKITCSENSVYAVWEDWRNGRPDIYFNYSPDNGLNWLVSDIRLDTGDTPGANDSTLPQIACTDSDVFAVWSDKRNGTYDDIYFNRAVPTTDIKANGSDGPLSITESDILQLRITLSNFGTSENVDYWLAYKGPSGWIHYNYSTKKWESGLGVTHQGPLMDLNNKKVFQSKLSPGNYTFYFGVDMVMNGKVTKSSLYKDEVQVTVTAN
jgi:hypothetical protein